ncbi:hypothetical protein QQ054_36730 [Oscillatoria amoena NRMC-F 0135]|nr:hypothetical protein [Oscillatoria amoena NRMC-F 0135]
MKKILLSVLIMAGTGAVFAQVPGTISYQGILVKTSPPADAGKPVDDGTHFVQFHFYNVASGGTALYASTGTGSGNSVSTYKGMFTFLIGSGSPGNAAIPANIFNQQLYVEIIADGVTLTPRIPLSTTPYAFASQTTNSVADNSVTTAKIVDGTITNADINTAAAIAVTKLATGTNGQVLTVSGGVPTWASPGPTGVTSVATGTGLTGGPITTTGTIAIANLGVTSSLLADNSVTSAKIVDGTIAPADIADGAVTLAKHADNSVNSAKIVDGSIADADVNATAAIAVSKLASGTAGQVLTTVSGVPTWTTPSVGGTVTSVGTGTGLTGGPITTTGTIAIANLGVTTALLADNSVTSAKIVDATIATADLADNSVTSAKIADGTIATADIADGAITAAKLASGATHSGSGTNGHVTFWTGTSALAGNANLFWDNTNSRLGIGTATPSYKLDVRSNAETTIYVDGGSTSDAWTYYGQAGTFRGAMGFRNGGVMTFFNGGDRMVILNNGNVGIGTTAPSQRLDVSGNITIPAANNYNYTTAKAQAKVISHAAFELANTNTAVFARRPLTGSSPPKPYYLTTVGGTLGNAAYFVAPVDLPDGATITTVSAWIFDSDATYDIGIHLVRSFYGSCCGSLTTMATVSSSGSPSQTSISTSAITNPVVDNANYSYFLIYTTVENQTSNGLYNVKINYTITKVD